MLLVIVVSAVFVTRLPSNESLIKEFQRNKEIFKTIRDMYVEDKNLYALGKYKNGENYVKYYNDKKDKLSGIQESKYFELLKAIGVDGIGDWEIEKVDEKNGIFYNVARSGWAGGGTVKRIVWLKERPEQLSIRNGTTTIKLHHIEDNWYLSEEHYP